MSGPPLRTERLILRGAEPSDAPVLHLLFSDAAVMRHIGDGSIPDAAAVRSFVDRQMSAQARSEPCLLIVVRDGDILGFTGLQTWSQPWGPQGILEIGWRLGRAYWGHGYATEAARAALDWYHARRTDGTGDSRLIAMIHADNGRSRAVATKLGMTALAEHVSPHGQLVLEYGVPPE